MRTLLFLFVLGMNSSALAQPLQIQTVSMQAAGDNFTLLETKEVPVVQEREVIVKKQLNNGLVIDVVEKRRVTIVEQVKTETFVTDKIFSITIIGQGKLPKEKWLETLGKPTIVVMSRFGLSEDRKSLFREGTLFLELQKDD